MLDTPEWSGNQLVPNRLWSNARLQFVFNIVQLFHKQTILWLGSRQLGLGIDIDFENVAILLYADDAALVYQIEED